MAKFTTPVSVDADPFAVTWDAADQFDPDGYHDPASNNTRLTVPVGKGSRLFFVKAEFENNLNGGTAEFRVDGSAVMARQGQCSAYSFSISAMLYLTDGQYVEVLVRGLNGRTLITTDFPCGFGIAPIS